MNAPITKEQITTAHLCGPLGQALAVLDGETWIYENGSRRRASANDIRFFFDLGLEVRPVDPLGSGPLTEDKLSALLERETRCFQALHDLLLGMDADLGDDLRSRSMRRANRLLADTEVAVFVERRFLRPVEKDKWDVAGARRLAEAERLSAVERLYAIVDGPLLLRVEKEIADWLTGQGRSSVDRAVEIEKAYDTGLVAALATALDRRTPIENESKIISAKNATWDRDLTIHMVKRLAVMIPTVDSLPENNHIDRFDSLRRFGPLAIWRVFSQTVSKDRTNQRIAWAFAERSILRARQLPSINMFSPLALGLTASVCVVICFFAWVIATQKASIEAHLMPGVVDFGKFTFFTVPRKSSLGAPEVTQAPVDGASAAQPNDKVGTSHDEPRIPQAADVGKSNLDLNQGLKAPVAAPSTGTDTKKPLETGIRQLTKGKHALIVQSNMTTKFLVRSGTIGLIMNGKTLGERTRDQPFTIFTSGYDSFEIVAKSAMAEVQIIEVLPGNRTATARIRSNRTKVTKYDTKPENGVLELGR